MIFFVMNFDSNVICITLHDLAQMVIENHAHTMLITSLGIFQTERHNGVAVYPLWYWERYVLLIIGIHLDLVAVGEAVHDVQAFKIADVDITFKSQCKYKPYYIFQNGDDIGWTLRILLIIDKAAIDELIELNFNVLLHHRFKLSSMLSIWFSIRFDITVLGSRPCMSSLDQDKTLMSFEKTLM